MSSVAGRRVRGTWVEAPEPGRVEILYDTIVAISTEGIIEDVISPSASGFDVAARDARSVGHLMFPGLIDLHVHAPQYPQLGQALDEPLEVWLHKYTFPLEARYADLDFARPRYETLVRDLLNNGTTTALYFATADLAATKLLADIAIDRGQRALIGKVVMDNHESCPDYYRDASAEGAVADTAAFIDYVRAHPANPGRVLPVVTPRFIPSCTDEALAGLGELVERTGAHVQTHCSESDWAHNHALGRYGETDTIALARMGLLTRRTILAHSNFVTKGDIETIRDREAAIAHCPTSNAYFANAVFPLRHALEAGLHVGLGTDISGGPISSIFDVVRSAVQVSRMLESGVDPDRSHDDRGRPNSAVTIATAFYLATTGGGIALDLPIGRLAPGYRFDTMAIDVGSPAGGVRLFGETDPSAVVERILYTANRANIAEIWVDGISVGGASPAP